MRKTWKYLLLLLGAAGIVVTFLPLIPTNTWWIRMLDYPRWEFLTGMLVVMLFYLPFFRRDRLATWMFVPALWVAIGYQAAVLAPWTPLAPSQVMQVSNCEGTQFRVFSANVLMTNRDDNALIQKVSSTNPDIVLLMETNEWWDSHLKPLYASYPYVVKHVAPNSYGMHLFSRIPLQNPEVRFLIASNVPSIFTGLQLTTGTVRMVAIHPRPPRESQSSADRDAELMRAALDMQQEQQPTFVVGDFNSVPWESAVRRMARIGGLMDLRIGRKFLATYSAKSWILRYGLDQVFVRPSFAMMDFHRLAFIGSDHFPIVTDLCYAPQYAKSQSAPGIQNNDLQKAQEAVAHAKPQPPKGVD